MGILLDTTPMNPTTITSDEGNDDKAKAREVLNRAVEEIRSLGLKIVPVQEFVDGDEVVAYDKLVLLKPDHPRLATAVQDVRTGRRGPRP